MWNLDSNNIVRQTDYIKPKENSVSNRVLFSTCSET